MDARTALPRRSALRLVSGLGVGGVLSLERGARTAIVADHGGDTRAIEIEWLSFADASGQELAQIRPFWMNDVTNHDGVATPDGQRDLAVRLTVRNTGTDDLVISPVRFALWDVRGFVVRPADIYADPATDTRDERDAWLRTEAQSYLFTAAPIAPRSEQEGAVTYRVPVEAWFRGLLFMPEPDRMLVLADFRREAPVSID